VLPLLAAALPSWALALAVRLFESLVLVLLEFFVLNEFLLWVELSVQVLVLFEFLVFVELLVLVLVLFESFVELLVLVLLELFVELLVLLWVELSVLVCVAFEPSFACAPLLSFWVAFAVAVCVTVPSVSPVGELLVLVGFASSGPDSPNASAIAVAIKVFFIEFPPQTGFGRRRPAESSKTATAYAVPSITTD
jgi:hypothetical protein